MDGIEGGGSENVRALEGRDSRLSGGGKGRNEREREREVEW